VSKVKEMTFLEHLQELRRRVMHSALVVIVAFFVCYAYHIELFDLISAPIQEGLIRHGIYRFRSLSVTEPIMVYLKVAFVGALIVGSPFLLFQMWLFIAPGLLEKERRLVVPIIFFSSFFFLLGIVFCYMVLLPFLTDFLIGVGEETAAVAVDVTLESALSYTLLFLIIFGVAFELPLVLFFMTLLGVTTPKKLLRFARYWLVISVLLGAIFTPPDPISQLMLAVPLIVLYFIGILGSVFAYRWKLHKEQHGSKVLSPLWSTLAIVLFSVLLVGFAWKIKSRGADHALAWVNPDKLAVVGFQPKVLKRDGLWAPIHADLVRVFSDMEPLLDDPSSLPDRIIVQTAHRGDRVAIIVDKNIHARVRKEVAEGLERRREGGATVYGTRSAIRTENGPLIVCSASRCAFGPARDVMETIRNHRAGIVDSDAMAVLEQLRQTGPLWGQVHGPFQGYLLRELQGQFHPEFKTVVKDITKVRFFLRQEEQGLRLLTMLIPRSSKGFENIKAKADSRKLDLMSAESMATHIDGTAEVNAAVLTYLMVQSMRDVESEEGNRFDGSQYPRLGSLRALSRADLFRSTPEPASKPRIVGTENSSLRYFLRHGLSVLNAKQTKNAVEAIWVMGQVQAKLD